MKPYLFAAFTLFALLVTACNPLPMIQPATPSATVTPLPTNTPVPNTPLPTNTPVPTTPVPSATPALANSAIACAPVALLQVGSLILGRSGAELQIFNLESKVETDRFKAPGNLTAVALSPDGKTLALAPGDNTIQLVSLSDHKLLHTLVGHTDQITGLKFTPDGSRLVSSSHDTWVREWDMNGTQLSAFQPTGALDWTSRVMGIGISPDGKVLATAPEDGPVKLWDLTSHKMVAELGGTGAYDTSDVAFSPDGQYVAADLATGLFVWKAADGRALLDSSAPINSMAFAFSPEGHYLAYADLNKVVLSSPDGAQVIRTMEGHMSPVWIMVFSPDGSKLATSDGVEVRIWQVPDGKLLFLRETSCP